MKKAKVVRRGRATKIIKENELLEAVVALVSNPFLIYDMFIIEGLAQPMMKPNGVKT